VCYRMSGDFRLVNRHSTFLFGWFILCCNWNFNRCLSDCCAHYGSFRKHYFNHREDSNDGTHAVPKHVGGYCLHLLCIYISACKVGFMSWLKTKYLMCHRKHARKKHMQSVGRRHRPSRLVGRQSYRRIREKPGSNSWPSCHLCEV
jgi:hypothetical protein